MSSRYETPVRDQETPEFPEISQFPALKNNQQLSAVQEKITKLKVDLEMERLEFKKFRKEIQEKCSHSNCKNNLEENKTPFGTQVLTSKTCNECGFTWYKPHGTKEEICESCWGEMEDLGREPGQGGGTFHYECKKCHHHVTST